MTDQSGFVAHDGVRPVVIVDFNSQLDGGVMWARRGHWTMQPGQPVILREPHGNGRGVHLDCDGHIAEVAPRNWQGKRCPEYVKVQIAEVANWRDGADSDALDEERAK